MRRISALVAAAAVAMLAVPSTTLPAAAAGSSGCGSTPPYAVGASTEATLSSGGRTRRYRIHLPTSYTKDQPSSVVLSFHGHGSSRQEQESLTGLSKLRTIAVYPQGITGTDGASAWQGAPYSSTADDVLFTNDLLTTLERQLCVDTKRLYASGKSNGGGFTALLACRMTSRIAAFAPVAGAYYPQAGPCNPSRPAPVKAFHGTGDTVIPYDGDPTRGLPAIPDWFAAWAQRDGCGASTSQTVGRTVYRQWSGCPLEQVRVNGLGHDWPSADPNATSLIWDYFNAHPLP
ncbi:alpha/beta hydrolase family esterase [Kribbella sp. NPDC051587]|uniref:alpha/beta hydrolase family esterase n=1 Tax=Kribbella sp. NPDC051587 TaxID=3364119 RepID=UPI0037A9EF8B